MDSNKAGVAVLMRAYKEEIMLAVPKNANYSELRDLKPVTSLQYRTRDIHGSPSFKTRSRFPDKDSIFTKVSVCVRLRPLNSFEDKAKMVSWNIKRKEDCYTI
jgi:hypothetical protein